MLKMNVADGCSPTASILSGLLRERRIDAAIVGDGQAMLCWGNGYDGPLPSLNRNASQFNKFQQLAVLSSPESHNLRTVPFYSTANVPANAFPVFMRKFSHAGGTDIRLALEPEQASIYTRAGWQFATKYVPSSTEYRVWIYRRQHLGTYQKHLTRQDEFLRSRHFGRNFDNGYSFQLVPSESVPRPAVEMAALAVDALGLDFGAVDMLLGRDGQYYILEVNTAPGVEGPDRQVIQLLADKIAYWVNHNYPRRNGDESAYERPSRQNQPVGTRPATLQTSASVEAIPPAMDERPSFLPRRGESYDAWARRVNA